MSGQRGKRGKRRAGRRISSASHPAWLLVWPGLVVLAFGLQRLAALRPDLVERYYAQGIFPIIARALSALFGLFPFSVAELTVWLLAPAALVLAAVAVLAVWKAPRRKRAAVLRRQATILLIVLSVSYAGFILLWGLNYSREPFAQITGMKTAPATVDELAGLSATLIDRANALRLRVLEDAHGVARLNDNVAGALARAQLGYDRAAALYPALAGRYSRPKGIYSSGLWSYTGTSGMYWPFTGEANLNIAAPAFSIPASAAHEMAHQHGFAREDEANYISYLTCRLHPDADFQYSGVEMALVNVLDALRRADPKRYAELIPRLSAGVKRDLNAEAAYWRRYEGPVSDYTDKVNDRYLKANGQAEGILSYDRMVDLLLAEYRAGEGR